MLPTPHTAKLKKLIDPTSGDTIDHGLVLWFPGKYILKQNFCSQEGGGGSECLINITSNP